MSKIVWKKKNESFFVSAFKVSVFLFDLNPSVSHWVWTNVFFFPQTELKHNVSHTTSHQKISFCGVFLDCLTQKRIHILQHQQQVMKFYKRPSNKQLNSFLKIDNPQNSYVSRIFLSFFFVQSWNCENKKKPNSVSRDIRMCSVITAAANLDCADLEHSLSFI